MTHGTHFTDSDGGSGYISLYMDMTERRHLADRLRVSEEELQLAMTQLGKTVCHYDIAARTLTVPKQYALLHGISEVNHNIPPELPEIERFTGSRQSADAYAGFYKAIIDGEASGSAEIMYRFENGRISWEKSNFVTVFDGGKPTRAIIFVEDTTDAREALIEIRHQAEIDGLTELFNRATVERMVNERLSKLNPERCLLIMLDLDDFKGINDNFGHIQGDRILRKIAYELKGYFRSSDVVGRIGGDEFTVFLSNVSSAELIRPKIASMINALSMLLVGDNDEYRTHCSAGCAFGCKKDSFETLLARADSALYSVKRQGKNGFAFYTRGD